MLTNDSEIARRNMVLQQIRPWDVFDERVLNVIQEVPREKFVPEAYLGLAFADIEVPLGHDQVMMAPRVEARMLQSLDVQPQHSVLEIGTGSGFIAACLARLGNRVTSIDLYQDFIDDATDRIEAIGLANKTDLRTADAFSESFADQRFDRIAVTGALLDYDRRFEQLLSRDGKLFVVSRDGATLVLEHGDDYSPVAVNRLEDRFSASPVLVGDSIYLRGERSLYRISSPGEVAAVDSDRD